MRADEKDYPKDAASLEKDIDETRADVRATLEALEQRLSPGQVLDYVVDLARRHGGDYAGSVGKAARQNPVATLLTAMGLAWLLTAARPLEDSDSIAAADQARAAGSLPPGAAVSGEAGRSGLDRFVHEQPLLIGAVGVALGAILGAALKPSNGARYLEELLEEEQSAATGTPASVGLGEHSTPPPTGGARETRSNGPASA